MNRSRIMTMAAGLLGLLLALAGCEASNQVQVNQPMLVRLTPYDSVAVSASARPTNAAAFAGELNQQLIDRLRASALFAQVLTGPEAGEHVPHGRVNLLVQVTHLRGIDPTLRYYAGVLAGPSEATAVATVFDARSGTEIGSATFEATSANDSVYGGTTQDVLDQLTGQILAWVARYKRPVLPDRANLPGGGTSGL